MARLATSTLVLGRKPIASAGSPRGESVSMTISQSVPRVASGMVNVIGSAPALNSSRNFLSVTGSPRGSGSLIADPLRKTATDLAIRRPPVLLGHLVPGRGEPGDVGRPGA